MKQESKRGGKREGAGRKATGRIKKPVTVYIEENVILEKGGIDAIRAIMVNAIYDNRKNPFINAARGRDKSGTNKDESKPTQNKPKEPQKDVPAINDTQNENECDNGAENASKQEIPPMPVREDFEKGVNGTIDFGAAKNEWKKKYNQ